MWTLSTDWTLNWFWILVKSKRSDHIFLIFSWTVSLLWSGADSFVFTSTAGVASLFFCSELLVFPRLLFTWCIVCFQESRRAAPCGTAATVASGMVDSSVIVRERADWGSVRTSSPTAMLVLWQKLGLQISEHSDPLLQVLALRALASAWMLCYWDTQLHCVQYKTHKLRLGPPPEILIWLVWGGSWHL